MIKKTIKYVDYEGVEREEDFFFHLNKAELVEFELSLNGGMSRMLQKVIRTDDGEVIIKEFKALILKAYGEKSTDGKRFIKNQELRDSFEQTEAYSILFMELVTDEAYAVKFINGIIPAEAQDRTTVMPPIK